MSKKQMDFRGALFPNKDKAPGSNQPDYSGSATINGVEYRMAGWRKMSRNNKPWVSFHFTPKEPEPERDADGDILFGESAPLPSRFEDDIPF